MPPLGATEKVLVSKSFLDTDHGQIGCENCHNGNPGDKTKAGAHKDFDAHPSINNPEGACGECHEDIVATAKNSLHATLSTFPTILKSRSSDKTWHDVDKGRAGHCFSCHTSCGGCHVSRPKFAKKGFVDGHNFQKRSDPLTQCTACHGSRIGNEYYGMRGQGDVHILKHDMDCVSCHEGEEMHAAAPEGLKGRYHLKEMVDCEDCHQDLKKDKVKEHKLHVGKVQCQVCHSQTYVNCYSCHTGTDSEGLRYFQNQLEVEDLKIGLMYDKEEPNNSAKYVLVRHEPSDLEVFDYYVKDGFPNFDKVPTWKRTSPHNIQRKTWQTASCNNCHGNRDMFLSNDDLLDYEVKANAPVVVPENLIPKTQKDAKALNIDTSKVQADRIVDAEWLHHNLGKKGVKVVDARKTSLYEAGHVEGAVHIDPLNSDLRMAADDKHPLLIINHDELTEAFGEYGLKADDHIVVYDMNGRNAGYLCWMLEYAGATNVSYLVDGMEGWHAAGYHVTADEPDEKETLFKGKINNAIFADDALITKSLNDKNTVIIDTRVIHQAKGIVKHGAADRPGCIPGSVNLPIAAFYMDNGALKTPEELLWMLEQHGVTPDKTVITSCNTGQFAGGVYPILRWLGFDKVKVHDSSWINWCKTN